MPTVTAALVPGDDRSFWDYCVNCDALVAMVPGEWLCDFCAVVTAAYYQHRPRSVMRRDGGGRDD